MNSIDQKLLNLLQEGLPLTAEPYHTLADQLGIPPEELLERLRSLRDEHYIRRIGGVLNPAKLGYRSMLYALEVNETRLRSTAEAMNHIPGITHNYRRDHRLNMWFTLTTCDEGERQHILNQILHLSEADRIYEFPKRQVFKLRVFFDMDGENRAYST